MMIKSLIAVGAVAGIGLMWMSRKYLYKKTRADLKSNQDGLDGSSTLATQSNIDDEKQISDTIVQCSSTEIPTLYNNEILPPQITHYLNFSQPLFKISYYLPNYVPHCPMINIELKKKSITPVELLHQLITGIKYEYKIMRKTPSIIKVETTIHGKPFDAQGPTKKHAKKLISIMVLYYFYGYNHVICAAKGWNPSLKSFKRIR